ncbi:MAG: peptidoglycan-binding protein [Candidatus Pacebacteria bacterium]|nr:peptidoglycan-binding protein [Candidatus Paceibacterota bacterium]
MKRLNKIFFVTFFTLLTIFGFTGQVWAVTIGSIDLVSKHTDGTQSDASTDYPKVSSNGRYVFFRSTASNLVSGDTNNEPDIFMHDTQTGVTTRVSVNTAGDEADLGGSYYDISTDGRYVVFISSSTNLVAGDTNNKTDIFVRDTQLNTTTRVSVSTAGVEGDDHASLSSMSSDGRYVAFSSNATNLVVGDTNNKGDIFVRDTQLNTTTRVSVSTAGVESNDSSQPNTISNDGRYVAFTSLATNLVANDINSKTDIFLRDTQTNTTTRISVDSNGLEPNDDSYLYSYSFVYPYFVFESYATNLVADDTNGVQDIFIHNIQTGETSRVSVSSAGVEGDTDSYYGTTSSDGRYVFFYSEATNLVANDTNANADVFVHDTQTGTTSRLSLDSNGAEINGYSGEAYVAYSGDYLVYSTDATTVVAGDTNGFTDIFLLSLSYISTPTTSTTSASSITTTTAVLTGNITDTGGENNTERGFDLGTDNTYTMSDVEDATGSYSTGSYSLTATGLTCGTTYHYRAYSTNTAGTGTGSDDTFATSSCPVAASTGGSVPVWILQSMSDAIRNTQNTNTSINNQTPSTPTPLPPTSQPKFQFTKNLKYRDRNNDVLELQKFLNNNDFPISMSGVASKGFETTYFGLATRNALIKFQKANNIKPAIGYFGVITRGVVNALSR